MPTFAAVPTRTAVKTANYTAAPDQLVPVDTATPNANVTVTLPTAPANGAQVTVKHVAVGAGRTVTLACGGTDKFNTATGPTTVVLSVANQAVTVVYDAATGVWTALDAGVSAASPTAGVNGLTHVFDMVGYGVVADAVTRSDGAMPATSTLTSAGASFAAGDVGKTIVVCNALGAGVHLYTTIAAYVSATQVTLAAPATATITSAIFTYGTNNTTAAQACITAAQAVYGVVLLPPTPFLITSALSITDGVKVRGQGVSLLSGHLALGTVSSGAIQAACLPQDAPYIAGSVIVQAGQNQNGITILPAAGGRAVDLERFGVYFAGMFKTTGHGVFADAAVLSANKDLGLSGFYWENIYVVGHDGTHYTTWLTNPLYGTISHLQGYGGGGLVVEANNTNCNMGNLVVTHPYFERITGSAAGIWTKITSGQVNLCTFIRPQVIRASLGSYWDRFSLDVVGTDGLKDGGAGGITVIAADIENNQLLNGNFGGWQFIGSCLMPNVSGLPEGVQYISKFGNRRLNMDGSLSLDIAESSGSVQRLLNDIPQSALWGITTDGTAQMVRPGTTRHTGRVPTAAAGAAVGTGAPPVIPAGADSAGRAIFGSGTSPTTGAVATFTFARAMQVGAIVKLQPNNSATQALGLYVSALSTTAFTVSCAVAPAASQAVTTYDFAWTAEDVTATPVAPVVYDNFNRADNASVVGSPQIGTAPTVLSGTWGISSNRLYCSASGGHIMWDAGKADATWQYVYGAAGVPSQEGLSFRVTDDNNLWLVSMDGQLSKRVAGSWTTGITTFTAPAVGDTISVVTLGSSIKIFKNGIQVGVTVTDAALSTNTHVGFRTNTASAFRPDNLSVT